MAATEAQWDVVVVGASFAGVACALAARHWGLRVCVLERKRDPGIKLHTTGIIVREAAEGTALARLPQILVQRIEGVRLYAPNLRHMALRSPGYYFLATDTPGVMRWLAGEAEAAGVELRLMQSFTDAHRIDGGWRVDGLGRCRWLVGADGAKSRVAMRAGLGRVREFLYGVEHEFDGLALDEPDRLHCFIDRMLAPGYIGWAVQNPRRVQLGLAFRHRPDRTGVPDIERFRQRVGALLGLPATAEATATRAGLIPCGGPVRPLAAANVILTGDAAGIVSPVTAGGIHSAWRHGEAVGAAIARQLRDGGPDPALEAERAAPRFRGKRLLRWAFDRLQADWPFDLLIGTPPLRELAARVFFSSRSGG